MAASEYSVLVYFLSQTFIGPQNVSILNGPTRGSSLRKKVFGYPPVWESIHGPIIYRKCSWAHHNVGGSVIVVMDSLLAGLGTVQMFSTGGHWAVGLCLPWLV